MFDTAGNPATDLDEVIERLAAEPLDVADAALSQRLQALTCAAERLQSEIVRTAAAWDGRRAWAADGALDPRAWLAHHTPTARPDARALVRQARLVREYERTAKALAVGDVTVGHVDVLARAAAHGREALYAEHEPALLDAAMNLDVHQLRIAARRWAVLADEHLARREAWMEHERREVTLAKTFGGAGIVNGRLDPEATALFEKALQAFDSGPDPVGGPVPARSARQRRADAFTDMCRAALSVRSGAARAVPAVDVTIDVETLAGATLADIRRARCDIVGVAPVARETIERMLCDCAVRRVLTDAKSEVLDLGRSARVASPAQRRALAHRDGGCVFPGCDRPPHMCDVHHLVRFPDGPTDLAQLALQCRRHHVLLHEGGWRLERDPATGTFVAHPP